MSHRVTLIPGDGVGPEITESARRIIAAAGVAIDWEVAAPAPRFSSSVIRVVCRAKPAIPSSAQGSP